jgi:large subunit ribosomal protein L24
MSWLSKAGARFRLDFQKIPRHRLPKYLKLQEATQPQFIRPQVPVDLKKDGAVSTDWTKLKYLVGDRVLIVEGEKKGNICKVSRHSEYGGYVLDENGPTDTVVVPKQFWTEGQTSHVVTFPKAVTEDKIRLVAEVEDEVTKQVKTVAVDHLDFKTGSYFDEDYHKVVPFRSVHGQPDMVIPWPRPEPVEDGPLSTEVAQVRERTYFVESVVRDAIPEEALLTIRNPHSKHRRGTLDRTLVKRLTPPEMPLTDTKKAYMAERAHLQKRSKVNITDEMKSFLGKKIREHELVKQKQWEEVRSL